MLSAADVQENNTLKTGLATQVALNYLKAEGIELEQPNSDQQEVRLGNVTFRPLQHGAAGYSSDDVGGYQILMNWRGPNHQFNEITMSEVLSDNIPPDLMRDRIVYIGSPAASTNDFFATPYNSGWLSAQEPMAGIFIHANITSQLIESALGDRALMQGVSIELQWSWILLWVLLSTVGNWKLEIYNHQEGQTRYWFLRPLTVTSLAAIILMGGGYLAFLRGFIIPLIAPLFALCTSAIATTSLFKKQRLHLTNKQLEFSVNFFFNLINLKYLIMILFKFH